DRARLLTVLTEQTDARDWRTARDRALVANAAALAVDDERVLLDTITGTYMMRCQPNTLDERLHDSDTAVRIADRTGDPLLQFRARYMRQMALVEAGDVDAAGAVVEEMERVIGGSELPLFRQMLGLEVSAQRLSAGDLAGAEAAADEVLAVMTAA